MKNDYKRTLVTCALPYANGPVHIGHLAGVYIPADIYVRYLRMKGEDVLFICGSDEHGVPITIKARKLGVSPQDIVDKYHNIIKNSFTGLGINFDIYSRTTSEYHNRNASEFFKKLYDEGEFVTKESEQYFDPQAKIFLADRYITGTCPKCGNPDAYGDQCEKCGSTLSPEELINPKSALSGSAPVKVKTKHWYLPLDQYEPWLREWILEQHKEWKTNVYGQCKSWLDGHLQPRAVSRDLDWGIPLPIPGAEGKVLYVWFDAPIGYISNTQELLPESWEKWWKSQDTRLIHFIGKDNIVFHCIVFPSMLKAHADYILPENVPANEFLNLEGDKISTSRNWAVWLNEYLDDFPGQEDVLRYVLCANAPETKDNDFTWKDFQQRNNSELVAILGNFVNRAVVLTDKYFGGKVPADIKPLPADKETLDLIPKCREAIEQNLDTFHFREALKEAMNIARIGNKYISDNEPWSVIKKDPDRAASILNVSLQICADLAIAFEPFLPFSAEKLRGILGVGINAGKDHRAGEKSTDSVNLYASGEGKALHTVSGSGISGSCDIVLDWNMFGKYDILPAGHELGKAELLFSKIEDSVVESQICKLNAEKSANEAAAKAAAAEKVVPVKPEVGFDDFDKMDIRTATVLDAVKVPKSDKLLKLTIDTGIDKRVIVSGIAKFYTPEQMQGKQICILANLKPRTIFGIESKGMILMAQQGDGTMRFVTPAEVVKNGSKVG
ncbi:MAG: methionine--tRNA ligase [Bacteroidales bacterium]|nr:methionine--tRNA ligase [Bacteroidales bacterium]MCI1784600.1 methionine--tRNA ligase [Bacteroidales bacterium]